MARAHQVETIDVWYFGTDPRVERPPLRSLPLHERPLAGPTDTKTAIAGRVLAVSTTLLYGPAVSPAHAVAADELRRLAPTDRTRTFFLYDLRSRTQGR